MVCMVGSLLIHKSFAPYLHQMTDKQGPVNECTEHVSELGISRIFLG